MQQMKLNVDWKAQIPEQTACVSDRKQKNFVKFAHDQPNLILDLFFFKCGITCLQNVTASWNWKQNH